MADDLHATIRAAVETRMALARAATPGPWTFGIVYGTVIRRHDRTTTAQTRNQHDAEHIAANDPATVIRGCEAELELLRTYEEAAAFYDRPENRHQPAGEVYGLWTAVRLLAAAYRIEVGDG